MPACSLKLTRDTGCFSCFAWSRALYKPLSKDKSLAVLVPSATLPSKYLTLALFVLFLISDYILPCMLAMSASSNSKSETLSSSVSVFFFFASGTISSASSDAMAQGTQKHEAGVVLRMRSMFTHDHVLH